MTTARDQSLTAFSKAFDQNLRGADPYDRYVSIAVATAAGLQATATEVWEPLVKEALDALGSVEPIKAVWAKVKLHRALGLPCPNDTDGDGNCGKPLCPWCGEER